MKKLLLSFAALFAAATTAFADLYVTPTGAGAKDGSSWANAFAGIQAAVDFVDAAVAADPNYAIPVIRVADGTYSRVSITNDIALDVRSVNGAASTVIDGGGTNNCVDVRLSGYTNFGQSPKFTGFTLRNGDVHALVYDRGGGAAGGSLFDCIIEDCVAWMGGGTYNANTMRCVIRRNRTTTYYGGAVYGGLHVNDLIVENNGYYAVIANASLYSSTVADNTARSNYYYFLNDSTARNCILWGNTVNGEACPQDDPSDPKFVGGGDYHLRAGSPALNDGLEDWQTEAYVGLTDLDDNDRVQGAKIDRGCYEAENGQGIVGVLVLASAEGNGTVSPAHSFVNVGATVTITADTSTWHRNVAAWYTNGVLAAAGSDLPAGLRPLEYVESTGDQYVDTGVFSDSTTVFSVDAQFTSWNTTGPECFGSHNNRFAFGKTGASETTFKFLIQTSTQIATGKQLDTDRHLFEIDMPGAVAKIDDLSKSFSRTVTQSGNSLWLFSRSGASAPCNARVFGCRIVQNDNLVRDLVPVLDADGVAGLFDRVSGTVFYSATATPLVAGPEKEAAGNSFTFTATGEQIDVVAQFATLDWFVNGTTGSDTANNGRTASTAFKTIQHAIDCAAPEEQIFVAAGTYAPIDASRANVAIIGDGRDTTIIDGGGTARCADLGERNFSYLQGFTLRNGRHMNVGTTPGQGEEGTGGGGAKGGFLIDCAIENCHSTFGGGAFHSEIHRSIIRDCSAYEGGGAIFGKYCNCLFDRNWATQGGAASSAELWGCTVVRSRAVDFAAVYVSSAYSTIFWGNKSGNGRTNYWLLEEGECCFEEEMDDYNVSFTGDPLFVDPENGDFRLREDSPCIDAGWGAELEDEFDVRGTGYPRRIDALGGEEIADMGCYEGGVPGHIVSVRVDGWGNVSQRTFAVDNGGSATITATTDGRAFQKWLVDGVEAGTSPTLTLSNIDADHVVTACFQRNTTTVSGGGAALQNAVAAAKDGDTLVVANGTYSAIDARGKVLTIVSENGPAAAIIRGSSTTRAATLSTSMTHPASTLAGFTVEGGTSTDLLYGGGGILGGYVSNCVVRGNAAYCGGGVAQAYVTHSIISNNTATVSGGGACATWLDTCLVVHNAANVNLAGFDLSPWGGGVPAAGDNESGGGGIAFSAANFCTITRNTSTTYAGGGMFVVLDNTYIAGNTADGGPAARQNADLFPQYPNHVCATSPNFIDDEGFVNADQDNSLVDPDNGDYRLKATSLCVEGGDTAFVSHRHATDLDGNPRWRGSAPDIGCYEAAGAAPVVVPDVDAWTGPVWEGDEGVLVEWGVSRGAEWYTVHRNTTDDFATATQVGRVDAPVTEFFDATAAISVRYRYWVVAHSTVGDGPVGASVEGYWVPELVITTPYLPNGLTRELYSTNLAATGGMPPYTWTVETPAWLSVSGNTISGMPRMAGPTTVRVTVEDADGQVDIRSWTLTIENNPAPLGPATPYAGEAYPGNYLIRNFDELRLFEETLRDPAGFDFEGATFTLMNDIDCGGRAFAPTNGTCWFFKGTFDGQGHVISNYVNNGYSTGSLLGDAGYGAVVKDVTLVGDIRLTTLWDRWGTTALSENSGAAAFAEFVQAGPAADAPPGLTMLNCHFVGTVTNDQSGDSGFAAAGLVAYVSKQGGFDASPVGTVNLRMSNCTVRASVDGREGAGGLVAAGFGIEATDCSVTGGVYRATNIGGLGGFIRRSSFTDCTFDGEIDAIPAKDPAEGGGGLVGAARGVTLRRCAARARVCWEYAVAHDDDHTFTACGGAIGVSWDDTACYDCSFEGSIQSRRGFFGGFIGWADSAEVFSNCHVRATYAPDGLSTRDATGGFAGVVSSAGAEFVDCSAESLGGGTMINSGFFASQQPVVQNVSGIPYTVGTNSFLRCSTKNMTAYNAGFCSSAWNCSFRGCSVRGVASNGAGFVGNAGNPPSGHLYAQNSLYEDCSVVGSQANYGFAEYSNSDSKNGSTNVFRRCRASGTFNEGFGALGKGSTAEDCAVVGMSAGSFEAGFAGSISTGATVRRCVGAVMPLPSETFGAGFADSIGYDSVVEDCYSVYAPTAAAIYDRQEGGFVRRTTLGISSSSATSSGLDKIARCFTLGAIPATGCSYIGSFCGGTPEYPYGATYDVRFEDCYRPAESPVGDFSKQDHAGVAAFTRAEFANATAATMPNYDFEHVWRAPGGDASSPYLKASTDENGNFWFYAAPPSGTGFILVNDEAPREAYPAGARIKVKAVGNGLPFTGWIGEGFDDPTAQETWYTVRNVSVIGATFGTPIYTVDDFTNVLSCASVSAPSGNYVLMNDLDFTGLFESNGWQNVRVGSFTGKFFGQGHTISNLCTTRGNFSSTVALFESVSAGAEIRDLTVYSSNVTNGQNTLSLAGLAASVGSGVTISNCHAVVDWQGVYPANYGSSALASCKYYGLAQTVSGSDIRIVDCTVRGRLAGGTQACGFVGSASLTGGEIARCAVFADVSTLTNRTDGMAAGFAGSISLSGGATIRECFSAGVVDAAANAAGFAYEISMRDDESQVRDCYSTAEVLSGVSQNPAGFACRISDNNDQGGVMPVANCWFGGTVRVRGKASGYYQPHGFAYYLDGDVSFENCAWIETPGANEAGTEGVTALPQAASRRAASWPGYDFTNVWSMAEDSTTPYFAWSLANGNFRLFAVQEPGATITHPATAAPGSAAAVSATSSGGAFFCGWAGACAYASASENPTTLLADNHRTARAVWGRAILSRADLAAVASNPSGIYGLGADIDLAGENWTPLCQDEYTPFTGTIYGQGHVISNLTVDTDGNSYNGLFGCLGAGATISDLTLVNPVVKGGYCTGALAGYANGATVTRCSAIGAKVEASGERAGGLVGFVENGSSFSQCYALGDVSSTSGYVGGFVGYVEDSPTFSECFACGSVTATGDNVGGFAGYLYDTPSLTDCYSLADVKGNRYVGGFVGQIYYFDGAVTRCYSAGSASGSSEIGGFAGRQYRGTPTFTDCFRISDGLADVGAADLVGIDALSAVAMHSRSSFAAFHAPGGKWAQIDGTTHPYFAWSLVDGKMTLGASVSGESAGCSVSGAGAYLPGATATVTAVPGGSALFLAWTGNVPYADPNAATTTLPVDNFRVVNAEFGTLISTRADLAAIAANPSGIYGLGADIDLAGADWTPLCDDSSPFTGTLYGRGHTISNLTVDTEGNYYAGLFGCISGGTVSDVRFVNPVVRGGTYTGTLVGRMTGASTVSGCSAIGATVEGGERTGGLVGDMQDSSTLARSFFLGDVTATGQYIGGLVGVVYKSGSSVSECFACGSVSSTSGYVGGLVGWVGDGPAISDCYALERVLGTDRVGGFVGHAETSSTSFRRCYAAGGDTYGSSNVGGFVGYRYSSPTFSDCIVLGDAGGVDGIASLDRAGMLQRSNFASYHATGKWSQIDGKTQPYFDWGLVGGRFLLGGDAAAITGLGAYVPGTSAAVSVNAAGRIFLGWTGNATYADSSSPSTTVLVDNYRTVSAEFGSLITTRAELEAVANDLSGSYALGADIDLSGSPWTPLGTFTGSLYGHGHKITGLTFSNTSSGDSNGSHAGLFRYASGATFDGIHLEGVSIRGYQYTGALAGEVQGATTVRNCSAQGVVTNSNGQAGLLVGQVYGSGTSFENCAATGTVYSSSTSSSDCGGLVGRVYYSPASFTDCDANVEVSGAGGNDKGGFIGAVRDGSAGATFTRCTASGAVASSNSDSVGGFLGYANKAVSCTDCSATGAVTGKNGTGGFAGNIDSVAHSFTRCVATGDASGTQNVGGFVGSTTGGNTQFVECEAQGKATGSSGSHAGGFVGQTTGTGTRFARCTAMGDASAPSEQVGGFAGYLNNSNDVWRCRSFGSASGTYRVGGFVGYLYSGNTAIRESFAIGDAAATRTTDEALAGGFAGQVNTSARLSDCYAIGVASGGYCVGGFAGKFVNSSISVTRCYAAGGIECAGTYGGAFVGNSGQYGTLADCAAVLAGGVHAVGSSTAGTTATLAGVSEFTAAEFRLRANFQAFHETGLWSQVNGSTQPYLAWGLVDGKMSLAGKSVGALGGSISGLGFYEPGDTVTIRAVTTGNAVFLGWTGNAPYANPDAAQTTIVLDNFRCVVASFGTSITTAADLAAIADKLDGTYALGADIDLSGSAWAPLGASTPFTGTLKGNGHVITGLSFSDTSNSDTGGNYAGLFRHVQDATIEDIHLEGVSLSGNKYVGALAGEVKGATTIRNCSAEGTVAANGEQAGLLVGRVTGAGTTFAHCAATGAVVSASSNAGGLVGYANVAATFEDCDAAVSVSGKGSAVGGFIGKTDTTAATFRRCSASGDVSNTSDTTGGFVGQSGAAGTVFENCVAEGAVSGTSSVGGFVGSTTGGNTQFVECDALGTVKGSSYYAGGFVGQTTANGIRYALCRALGGVSSTSYNMGGFVGYISNSNDVWRCMSAGSVKGDYNVGGFVGNFDGANTAIRECFALGDATSTRTGNNDAAAGGFAGRIGSTNPKFSDSYCLGAVAAATRVAGGFAGKFDSGTISLTRCYAAGTVECPGTYVGAFVGTTNTYAAAINDCAVLCGAIHGVGLSTAGASDTLANVAEYNEVGMKNADNFHTWLDIDDEDGSVWTQSDGVSQPVLAWSAPGGKLTIYESIGGSGHGHVDGAYDWYDPGTVVEIAAVPDESFFVDWTGSTPYADPAASPTTIPLDNHRVAAVRFGKLITTADELDAVRNDLGGIYGLGADIDLWGREWTPIGFNGAKFAGRFYGRGYEIRNLVCTNSPSSQYHGLFGWTEGATLEGITVSGTVKATAYYTGGLVGCANATTIRGCHADVTVSSTAYYTGGLVGGIGAGTTISGCSSKGSVTSTSDYAGGLAGNGGGGNFEIRDCVSSVETVGSTYVGGLIGYVSGGDTVISGCRADGYTCCTSQSVGGFIGGVNSSLTISNCVARGDVRCKKGATYAGYGGFVGYMNGSSTVIADSWCSGAVWGQGANCGAFVGYSRYGTVRNCSIYAFGAGPRPFSGSDGNLNGGSLTASQIELLSKDENGDPWPTVKNHAHSATKIRTVEDLFAVTNNLDGIYALANDINLGGAAWTPIGNASAGFTGEFYGENHCISNFVVNSSVSGAGLFGCIAGGRVNGVRAYGSVTGSNQQVGGFVGRLAQMSLVDGCSFSGTVSGSQYVVGGFVGRICDSPVVLRSCAVNCTVTFTGEGGSYKNAYAGGFVGSHDAGYVMDCYAVADVSSVNQARYVGGFAGNVNGQVTTSWCAGSAETTGSFLGAFAGYAQSGYITKSYYDSGKTSYLAVSDAAYTGITPLASSEMLHEANFPDFDFDRTWLIDEGATTPYLQTFIVVKRGFDVWAEQAGYPEGTEPGDVVDGIPAGIRYVYNIPADATSLYALPGEDFFHVAMDAYGNPCVKFRAKRDPYEGVVVSETVVATDDLLDWTHPIAMRYDALSDLWKPADGIYRDQMFFKWRIVLDRTDE